MPLQATSGAASYDAFGGGVPIVPNYIEEFFSAWLYTGNGSTQTITNGVGLSGKSGLVWIKSRSAATNNFLFDTARGALNEINSNTTDAEASLANSLTAFTTDGFSLEGAAGVNTNAATYVSWTFREKTKFFDVVTFTGTGSTRTVSHNLGSVPGCIIVKDTTQGGSNWRVYHSSLGATKSLRLNSTGAESVDSTQWNDTAPTSTQFTVGSSADINASGSTMVAYLFASNAGGFGRSGTDNVISCGSYVGASGRTVDLGYEPQLVIIKRANDTGAWSMWDNTRGVSTFFSASVGAGNYLQAQAATAETAVQANVQFNSTGFSLGSAALVNSNGDTYIYIAIRRGPMKAPTSAASVFGLNARTGTGAAVAVAGGQFDDLVWVKNRGATASATFASRLTGARYLLSSSITEENTSGTIFQTNAWDLMDGVKVGTGSVNANTNTSGNTYINYFFKRAPSFMDVVCYTGTGAARTVTHNLGVAPELIIYKNRSSVASWAVQSSYLPSVTGSILQLESTNAVATVANYYTTPTSTTIGFGSGAPTDGSINNSGQIYISYLFATLAGISKVGSYTGNGTTQTIDCGFTSGARFVLIKRTDATGDWYTYDTARGMTVLTDPYFLMNTTAAEVATLGSVTTVTTGFALNSTILAAINVNAGTYIFLAIA